jgi:methyl-accepting chemotaxis protein
MRKNLLALAFLALVASPCLAGHPHFDGHLFGDDDISYEIEDGAVVIEHEGRGGDETVRLTRDGELFIDDERIELDRSQRRLVSEFYEDSETLEAAATAVGMEGARIGVEGVRVAIRALAKVVKLLDDDYDSEDLEREIEAETEGLELKADALEEKAEVIEEMADELEDLADQLRESVPELDDLGWF